MMFPTTFRLSIVSLALICANHSGAQVITTVAGSGSFGYTGDGGPALLAEMQPMAVTTDAAGNVYVTETGNNTVRKISTTGIITTIAGNVSLTGYSGDLGPATAASMKTPYSIAVDAAGDIYIADMQNHAIRKVNSSGVITTVAGNGTYGYSGDGGMAIAAKIAGPAGIAFDGPGNLYIADRSNHVVRKVTTAGIISTIAGNGLSGSSGDGGPATAAMLNAPNGLAVDAAGNVYVSDVLDNTVRKISTSGTITTIAGNGIYGYGGDGGPATSAKIANPEGLAIDGAGNVYIADYINDRIRKVTPSGTITTFAGNGVGGYSGDGGAPTAASIGSPTGISVNSAGTFYIVGKLTPVVRRIGNPLGLDQNTVNNKCAIYPNPNNGRFTISGALSGYGGNALVSITNMLGQVVYQKTATLNNGTINEQIQQNGKLPKGIYVMNIVSGNDGFRTIICC